MTGKNIQGEKQNKLRNRIYHIVVLHLWMEMIVEKCYMVKLLKNKNKGQQSGQIVPRIKET